MAGIYIHVPFCKQACSYCDFYFVTRQGLRSSFVERLCEEIASYAHTPFAEQTVQTIYFGGGTPSLLLPGELEQIFTHLDRTFRLEPLEVTMELNPDDVDREYLEALRRLGVHRVSMGIQSFDPHRLTFMNRAHTSQEANRALELLAEGGFRIYSADLIYGQPGQTADDLSEDLELLLAFDPPHISAYALTIEPRTRLGRQKELGRLQPADEELVAEQFDLIAEKLDDAGILRYEVSNYSKPGFEALHNTRYWTHCNYLGFGPAAHSFWWDAGGARRWECSRDLGSYLTGPLDSCRSDPEPLSLKRLAEERLMLGLRTRKGVRLQELNERYGYRFKPSQEQWLERSQAEELVLYDRERVALSQKGVKIADHLILELLSRD